MSPDPKKLLPPRGVADTTPDHAPAPLYGAGAGTGEPEVALAAPTTPPAALSAPPGLANLVQAFQRCWKVALLVALLGGSAAASVAWMLVPAQYTSQILFKIHMRPPRGSIEGQTEFAN